MFGFGRRRARKAATLADLQRGHATVLQIGRSVTQEHRNSVVVKLRLRVELAAAPPYECSVPWEIPQGSVALVAPGSRVAVRVDPADPKHVHPADASMTLSRLYDHWTR